MKMNPCVMPRLVLMASLALSFLSLGYAHAARTVVDFSTLTGSPTPSLSLGGVTVFGSNDVSFHDFSPGLGIIGGVNDGFLDNFDSFGGAEYLDITFDNGPVNRIGIQGGDSFYGTGEVTFEAFGPGNSSLGTTTFITGKGNRYMSAVSSAFGEQPIERIRIIAEANQGMIITGLTYDSALPPAPNSLTFNINNLGGFEPGTPARMALDAATDFWSNTFSDPIEINLDVMVEPLSGSTIGSASSNTEDFSYTDYRNALAADATSPDDFTTVSNLPIGSFDMQANGTSSNNTTLQINTANAKAAGLIGATSPVTDATISLRPGDFDYDQSDGIDAGKTDVTATLIHELGHAMGFELNGNGGTGKVRPLNLHRFTAESAASGAIDFSDITEGEFYFSIDGGVTNITGGTAWNNQGGIGSKFQHWKQDSGLGIMTPTQGPGTLGVASALDIQAFDVIGWTLAVPEPSSGVLGFLAMLGMFSSHRNRRNVA